MNSADPDLKLSMHLLGKPTRIKRYRLSGALVEGRLPLHPSSASAIAELERPAPRKGKRRRHGPVERAGDSHHDAATGTPYWPGECGNMQARSAGTQNGTSAPAPSLRWARRRMPDYGENGI